MLKRSMISVIAIAVIFIGGMASAQTHIGNVTITGQAITLQSGQNANLVSGNFIVGSTNPKQFFWSHVTANWNFNSSMKVDGSLLCNTFNVGQAVNTTSGNAFILFGASPNQEQFRWNSASGGAFETTDDLRVLGNATVNILEILGGSDLAEDFAVNGQKDIEPGTVVAIDAENAGELKVSTKAYDRAVAGIVSGAGGLSVGMRMGQDGSIADGDHPVALTGRVYCKADATMAAIAPGDLLTTSSIPGHAMKVLDHAQATGAVIGKAMTPLAQGETGLVLVLVSLQ